MDIDAVRNAVHATLAAIAPECDVRRLRPDRPLREQVELDSMDCLNLVAGLEERLRVRIPESDRGRLTTLDALVAYIVARPAQPVAGMADADGTAPDALPRARHLVDGTWVTVRPMHKEDAALEAAFVRHLSAESRYMRFMATLRELPDAKLRHLTDVDGVAHVALIATVQRDERDVPVGVARYVVDASGASCEFAIAVDDAWQGSGLAGILMATLIDIARKRGLARMEGLVLRSNRRMLKFARQLGFSVQDERDDRLVVRAVRTL